MKELNEIALFILIVVLVYTVFKFNQKINIEIEIKKIALENAGLDRTIKNMEIELNEKLSKKLDK